MYEIFEHTADLGIRIRAEGCGSLFEEAGRALISVIIENPNDINPEKETEIKVKGTDLEYLLFDWLNELLFLFDTERMVPGWFEVIKTEEGISARIRGEKLDNTKHRIDHEVKAITYHGLNVVQNDDSWTAEVIIDI